MVPGFLAGRLGGSAGRTVAWTGRGWRRVGLRGVADVDTDVADARERLDGLADVPHEGGVVGSAKQQGEPDFSVNGGGDIPNHFGGQDVGAGAWVFDRGECS